MFGHPNFFRYFASSIGPRPLIKVRRIKTKKVIYLEFIDGANPTNTGTEYAYSENMVIRKKSDVAGFSLFCFCQAKIF